VPRSSRLWKPVSAKPVSPKSEGYFQYWKNLSSLQCTYASSIPLTCLVLAISIQYP
jgi:hypothetical protein